MPLRHVRELTAQERAALTELYKSSSEVEVVHRSHAVLLSADGWRVSKIAELLRVDQSTVHRWFDRFEADGLAGLATEWSDGRPPAWDESLRMAAGRDGAPRSTLVRAGAVVVDVLALGRLSRRANRDQPERRAGTGAAASAWHSSQAAHPGRA